MSTSLPAPRGKTRIQDPPEVATETAEVDLSISQAVPRALWKHLLIAAGWALLGGLILWASEASRLAATSRPEPGRPELVRLMHLGRGTLHAWASGLILLWTAQLAWLIRWVRSRSLKDFDGQYRVWTKVSACWFLFSFCTATGAHRVWSEDVRQVWPANFWQREMLSWLIPAVVLGVGLVWVLHREMAGCRLSLGFLQAASVLYLGAAALHLGVPQLLPAHAQHLAGQATTWAGHVLLTLSMQWHLSYVIHRTSDPSPASRRWKLPKPHFSLARLKAWSASQKRLSATGTPAPQAGESAPEPKTAKKAAARKKPEVPEIEAKAEESVSERKAKPDSVKGTSPAAVEAEKPAPREESARIRIDNRHGDAIGTKAPDAGNAAASKPMKSAESAPAPRPESKETRVTPPTPPTVSAPAATSAPAKPSTAAAPSTAVPPTKAQASPPERPSQNAEADDEDDEPGSESSASNRPDLRGLSKKQRRRLMQEQRAKERGGRDQYADSDDD